MRRSLALFVAAVLCLPALAQDMAFNHSDKVIQLLAE